MKDRFSTHAQQYAAFRPQYPEELYAFIFTHVAKFGVAWDAGTGNGQAAGVLAKHFKKVYATDISGKQLEHAVRGPNIEYALAGELTQLPDQSVDLVTVAQAIHWFNRKTFFAEIQRVGRPGALVAAWGYGLLQIDKAIDPLLAHFYFSVVGPYWDPERRLIDEHYQTINFPLKEVPAPLFNMFFDWTLAELEGYLTTWSSVQKYIEVRGSNPVPGLIQKIRLHAVSPKMRVKFPLFLRLGKL